MTDLERLNDAWRMAGLVLSRRPFRAAAFARADHWELAWMHDPARPGGPLQLCAPVQRPDVGYAPILECPLETRAGAWAALPSLWDACVEAEKEIQNRIWAAGNSIEAFCRTHLPYDLRNQFPGGGDLDELRSLVRKGVTE